MDQEIIGLLAQLDGIISSVIGNPTIPVDKLRQLQSRRAQLDRRFADFRQDLESRYKSFKSTLESEIKSIQQQAATLQDTDK